MPSQDVRRASDQGRRLSRRSLLQGAATAGAAGLAVTAIGAAATPAFAATGHASGHDGARRPAGPITVHVRDVRSGDIEVFSGTRQTRLRDKHLAALIAKAIGLFLLSR